MTHMQPKAWSSFPGWQNTRTKKKGVKTENASRVSWVRTHMSAKKGLCRGANGEVVSAAVTADPCFMAFCDMTMNG